MGDTDGPCPLTPSHLLTMKRSAIQPPPGVFETLTNPTCTVDEGGDVYSTSRMNFGPDGTKSIFHLFNLAPRTFPHPGIFKSMILS